MNAKEIRQHIYNTKKKEENYHNLFQININIRKLLKRNN